MISSPLDAIFGLPQKFGFFVEFGNFMFIAIKRK